MFHSHRVNAKNPLLKKDILFIHFFPDISFKLFAFFMNNSFSTNLYNEMDFCIIKYCPLKASLMYLTNLNSNGIMTS